MIAKSNVSKPDYIKQRILGRIKSYTVPNDITEILPYAFYMCGYNNFEGQKYTGTIIYIPDSVTSIGEAAFRGGYKMFGGTNVQALHTIPHMPVNLTSIGKTAFDHCEFPNGYIIPNTVTSLPAQGAITSDLVDIPGSIEILIDQCFTNSTFKTAILRSGIQKLNGRVFENNRSLKTVNLPSSITYTNLALIPFSGCTNLEFVTLEQEFNASIKLNNSTKYSHDTILSWFNALYDRTGLTANTLTIGSTNIAKMTAQEIAIATSKNWTIA